MAKEVELLALEKRLSGSANWHARTQAFARHHRTDLDKLAHAKKIKGAITVRNSIAHGLGTLTPLQTLSAAPRKSIEGLGIAVSGIRVQIRDQDVENVAAWSRGYLLDLDQKVPQVV